MTDQRSSGEQWVAAPSAEGYYVRQIGVDGGVGFGPMGSAVARPLARFLNANRPDLGTDWQGIAGRLAGALGILRKEIPHVNGGQTQSLQRWHKVIEAALAAYEGKSRA